MFFHRKVVAELPKVKRSAKDQKKLYDQCGLSPIVCNQKVESFMRNTFGYIRNDIQAFMRTSDVKLQQQIVNNLNVVQQAKNTDATVQDVFDGIIPNNIQTPADIQKFGRVLAQRYDGFVSRHSKVSELKEKSKDTIDFSETVQPKD